MKTAHWEKIERIYDAALKVDASDRLGFVKKQTQGDEKISKYVMKMLEADDNQNFMSDYPGKINANNIDLALPEQLGHFKIIKKIATGGMGRVYLGQSTTADVDIKVALKTIRIELISAELKDKFQNEKNILSQLRHKNIASLIDAGISDNQIPYIATEWVDGENIKDYCIKHNLSVKKRLRLFLQVCDAMIFAHNKLIIHRDLKPENILVNNHKQVKLLDFGIAKIIDENQNNQTQTQIFTPDYAAPEQLSGEMCTAATDIYSLGIILFEILTNSKRFNLSGLAIAEKIKAIAIPKQADLSDVQPYKPLPYSISQLKGPLYNVINKAMHVEPNRRYDSVASLVSDIENYIDNRPVRAMKDSVFYKTKMLFLRNKLASGFLAIAFVAISSGLFVANKQLVLKQRESKKSKVMLDFFNKILDTSSPVHGGSLNMSVREMFEKGIAKIELDSIDDSYIKAELANKIGLIYAELGQGDKSLDYYMVSTSYYENNLSETNFASIYIQNAMQVASKLMLKGNLDKALIYIQSALQKVKSYSINPEQKSLANIYLARIYGQKENKKKAFVFFDIAEKLASSIINNSDQKHSLLGEIYFYRYSLFYASHKYKDSIKLLDTAEFYFKQSLNSQYNPNLNITLVSKANLLSRHGQLKKADGLYTQFRTNQIRIYGNESFVNLTNQAKNNLRMGEFNKALSLLIKAEDVFNQSVKTKAMNYYGLLLNKTNAKIGLEQYHKVKENFDEILQYMHNILPHEHRILKIVYNDLTLFYLKTSNLEGLKQSKTRLLEYLANDKGTTLLTQAVRLSCLINLANIYWFEKDYHLALKYYQKADDITVNEVEEYNQRWLYWQLQTGLLLAKYKQGDLFSLKDFQIAKKRLLEKLPGDKFYTTFFSVE
jgi:serine/threonine-protein kinase